MILDQASALARMVPVMSLEKDKKPGYGQGHEAQAVRDELAGFNYLTSPAWKAITDYFGANIRLRELKGIVYALSYHVKATQGKVLPSLSRNAKRNLGLLVRHIHDNFDDLVPLFPLTALLDANKEDIPFLDATNRS
jgi:hypothetical protein